jgi:hypothetical protein
MSSTPTSAPRKARATPAEKSATKSALAAPPASPADPGGKLGILVSLLRSPDGTTLDEMVGATGWQPHSVRGALAGSLKKRGFVASSAKAPGGARRYRLAGGEGSNS